jgi:ribonuclease P protein component
VTDTVTLKSNSDFRRIYARGKAYTNPALVIYLMKNRAGICRIGITTSKKIGNAVERNRSKRVIRAAFRSIEREINGGYDIVFVARGRTKYTKSTVLCEIMRKNFLSAGVIKNDSSFNKAD